MQRPALFIKWICIGIVFFLFLGGCSPAGRSRPEPAQKETTANQRTTSPDVTIATGDTGQINKEIPAVTGDLFSSPSSLYYSPGFNTTNRQTDDFLPDDTERPLPTRAYTPPAATATPAAPHKPAATPVAPHKPAATPAAPSQGKSNQDQKIAEARARYEEAYKNYTDIVTGNKKGDAQAAQAEYRETYRQYMILRNKANK